MALIAVVSPGNAPGATTTAFALTLAWPRPVLLAECSPAGGHLLPGYFQGRYPADRGLWQWSLNARHGVQAAVEDLPNQTLPLGQDGTRMLLPGGRDPFRMDQMAQQPEMWQNVALALTEQPADVIADIGHVGADLPFEIVRRAQLVLLVMKPTLAQTAAARPRLEQLREALGGGASLGLVVVGEGRYPLSEMVASLGKGFAFSVQWPVDPKSAEVLTEGAAEPRKFAKGPLMRQAADTAGRIDQLLVRRPPSSMVMPLGGVA